ncbi:hypothetical protein LEP1GSC127_2695 [Leptospira kirschneri str. 200801925]|uniref:Uncharacterized protein n=1 Tax=Leptospira kirschneri str. 200802841 TaxID=1193047 RepID=A0A828Y1Y9_9LEPT|nr:hypothetical protein LEP1GSC131_2776 [Leptospira kirschneri str. 200802841]EKQ82135.1 hypothetical protein LEP1GSC064_4129 [Leptospira kirschneri serovar Grippotyphosa str. Moskva]EKR06938.1 hypothetical protein LEP1GSC122_3653 [Leptospira kirschneri serovar Valbuzzi str. 200702274]EMK01252.1 hypothetical protein LEP1GSC176_1215 [Leptospira kirschneri str. MMD1493]EMO77551.1 hypothetical protein LEP1GSC127_2695 [Leptospira kirschneri str. 200801925]OOV48807.1 hypothetical protein B1J94_0954
MKLNASASYGSLCRIAFETQQNALYGSRSRYVLCIEKMSGQDLTKAFIKFSSVEGIWKSQSYFSK